MLQSIKLITITTINAYQYKFFVIWHFSLSLRFEPNLKKSKPNADLDVHLRWSVKDITKIPFRGNKYLTHTIQQSFMSSRSALVNFQRSNKNVLICVGHCLILTHKSVKTDFSGW